MITAIAVDDEYSTLKLLPHIIDWAEYGLTLEKTFSTAASALSWLEEHKTDVVFTDICMPNIDGIDFAKNLSENFPDVTVVFISAHKDFEYAKNALKYGVFDYITKPLDFDELDKLLTRLSQTLLQKQSDKDNYTIYEKQQLILDFVSGNVTAQELISTLKLPKDWSEKTAPSAILRISTRNLAPFLNQKWAYGIDRLYSCLIRFLENDKTEIVPLKLSFKHAEILVFSRFCDDNTSFLSLLENMKNDFSAICRRELTLSASLEIAEMYSGLTETKASLIDMQLISEASASQKNTDVMHRALAYIDKNLSGDISLSDVAGSVFLSPYHFSRLFKQYQKENFSDFILRKRLEYAQKLLKTNQYTVSQVAEMSGFINRNYFHRVFKHNIGCTPKEYIQQELEKDARS